ncbi:MAG: TCP-1/cpn60 chaperonin family protein, partial [bacterium]
ISTKENTTIVGGKGEADKIKDRIEMIRKEMAQAESDFDKEKLQERLAKLTGGVAVIKVGAATETEMKEKKHRVEDALEATKAAGDEGIVVGGGVALIRAMRALDRVAVRGGEQVGLNILKKALEAPIRQIAINAGKDGSVVAQKVREGENNFGYNAAEDRFEDLVQAGIIDPTKVTRSALQNAASVAAMMLTTEAVITDLPKKDDKEHDMSHHMSGMGGMM